MFRLTVCCLLLGAALAKPAEKTSGVSAKAAPGSGSLRSVRAALEFESAGQHDDPQPLPKPTTNSTDLRDIEYFTLYPGTYFFTSPNHPGHYNNSDYFAYVFTGSSDQLINVYCHPFDVEDHPLCEYDWLALDGFKQCGHGSIIYDSYKLVAEFKTDATITDTGFYCLLTVP